MFTGVDPKKQIDDIIEIILKDKTIEEQARLEVQFEEFRRKVEVKKAEIIETNGKSWYQKLFPFKITIERT